VEEVIYKENTKGYKVLTPDGYKAFAGIRCLGYRPIYRVEFEQGFWLECTNNHKLFVDNTTKVSVEQLLVNDTVLSVQGLIKITNIVDTGATQLVYDLIEVEGGHRYYTNGVLSSNCEFIIFDETLISPIHLMEMSGLDPMERQGQVRWYKKPQAQHTYALALDPSMGTGGDPAAIQIFELPSFTQVGEWQHNRTPIQQQIGILTEIIKYLSETVPQTSIYYSVENNSVGEAALICIDEVGEENIKGIFLSEPRSSGGGRRYRKGFNTTNKSKLSACAKLKNLVETKRMTIVSKPLISELKTFVSSGPGFAAKPGETDDLVMSLILIVRMAMLLQSFDSQIDYTMKNSLEDVVEPMPFWIT
jgi:hypothetical protein